jgi:hypothetical protein
MVDMPSVNKEQLRAWYKENAGIPPAYTNDFREFFFPNSKEGVAEMMDFTLAYWHRIKNVSYLSEDVRECGDWPAGWIVRVYKET